MTRKSLSKYGMIALSLGLGGQIVTVVPSTVGKIVAQSSPEIEWKWAVDGLKEICAYAQERNIRIALEPLNRFETYLLALADEVGFASCGIAFDPFHPDMEEQDLYKALESCGSRLFDVHLGDNNCRAPDDGHIDWSRFIFIIQSIGYTSGLANESIPPIDRTPASPYKEFGGQLELDPIGVDPRLLQFLKDHGSGVLSDKFYTTLLKRKQHKRYYLLLKGAFDRNVRGLVDKMKSYLNKRK